MCEANHKIALQLLCNAYSRSVPVKMHICNYVNRLRNHYLAMRGLRSASELALLREGGRCFAPLSLRTYMLLMYCALF